MTAAMETSVTTQVYRVYIKASPQAIWDAITKPEWTERYGMGGRVEYDLRPGGAYLVPTTVDMRKAGAKMGLSVPDVMVDGEVIEVDPPRRLVHTFRMLMDETTAAEGFTRLTWEIDELPGGISKLTVTHQLEGTPNLAAMSAGEREGAGGGWSWVLSDLKTLLETGASLASGRDRG